MLTPDYIFETSWEVCNKVGGIYAVLSTRAASMLREHPDKVVFFGPDFSEHSDIYFREDPSIFADWTHTLSPRLKALKMRVGRWAVPGNPIAVLLRFDSLWSEKNDIYAWAWEHFGVRSHAAYGDYDESCLFGFAAGMAMESLYRFLAAKQPQSAISCCAHANEWQTAFSIFYLRNHCPQIRT